MTYIKYIESKLLKNDIEQEENYHDRLFQNLK